MALLSLSPDRRYRRREPVDVPTQSIPCCTPFFIAQSQLRIHMNETDDEAIPHRDLGVDGATADQVSLAHRAVSLRGAAAINVGPRFWLIAATIGLIVFAAVLVVSVDSVATNHARVNRMKSHGIPVVVTVTSCDGNLGGSGSNAAGYSCRGDYTVDGTTYHEAIGSKSTYSPPGAQVRAIVDPSHHTTVVLSSAVKASEDSPWAYGVLGLLAVALVALALALLRLARPSVATRHRASVAGPTRER